MRHGLGGRAPAGLGAVVVGVLVVGALLLPAPAAAKAVPTLTARVTDQADMIPDATERGLEEMLVRYEQETGSQVVVLTVESLEGEVLEDYSYRVASENGIGREGVDDGVLLLVAEQDRKLRIEVGYGLEADLTDAEAGRIIRNVITPRFKQGDFGAGVEEGVGAILGTLRNEPGAVPDEPPSGAAGGSGSRLERGFAGLFLFLVLGVFGLLAIFGKGCSSYFLFFFLMPFVGAFGGDVFGGDGGLTLIVGWIFVFLVAKFFLRGTERGRKWVSGSPILSGLSSWSTSGTGGGFSSGGGFSGGGGSFGGGGASGSW